MFVWQIRIGRDGPWGGIRRDAPPGVRGIALGVVLFVRSEVWFRNLRELLSFVFFFVLSF